MNPTSAHPLPDGRLAHKARPSPASGCAHHAAHAIRTHHCCILCFPPRLTPHPHTPTTTTCKSKWAVACVWGWGAMEVGGTHAGSEEHPCMPPPTLSTHPPSPLSNFRTECPSSTVAGSRAERSARSREARRTPLNSCGPPSHSAKVKLLRREPLSRHSSTLPNKRV
jgi:hypothetical protein